jgi:hypothetical protein
MFHPLGFATNANTVFRNRVWRTPFTRPSNLLISYFTFHFPFPLPISAGKIFTTGRKESQAVSMDVLALATRMATKP